MPESVRQHGVFHAEGKHLRELRRIRNSASFRISQLFTHAVSKPWRLLWLPLSMLILLSTIGQERLGKKKFKVAKTTAPAPGTTRRCIVFFPTNGVGFGHFTRLFGIARRVRQIDDSVELVFFTTASTLHLLENERYPAYHLPSRKTFEGMSPGTWNAITEEMMEAAFAIHRPSLFVFDGAFPYRGMLNGIKNHDEMGKIWLRRRTFRKGSSGIPLDSIQHFNAIIHPKDSIEEEVRTEHDLTMIQCDPIIFAEREELLSRNEVRDRLGIPADAIIAYVQLGAGRINDITSDISITLDVLGKFDNVYTVLAESLIGDRINVRGDRLLILRDYPNSFLYEGFDFAVIAGGYNSYHEVMEFGLPTLCYPNPKTGKDDQYARVKVAEDVGAMLVLRKVTREKVSDEIEKLMDPDMREQMRIASRSLRRPNGAVQVAEFLLESIGDS